ncbi:hypothetical protein ACJJTC_018335 [Scirpophaga incertulas]
MKGDFRTLLKKYCLESSILGLKYFYLYPDWISRTFWATNMLIIFFLACYLTMMLYGRFQEMPTRITIENQYEPVKDLPYPAITICSPNQITLSALMHFNKTLVNRNLTTNIETIIPNLLGYYKRIVDYNMDQLQLLQSLIVLNRYTIPEVMTLLPQKCDQFLKMCYFQKQLYPQCKELFVPILTTHGLCCVFNSVYYLRDMKRNEENREFVSHSVKATGLASALTVIADYQPEDALDGTIVNAGALRVLFTDCTEFPADDISNMVVTNAETFHVIHATYTYCSDEVKQLPVSSRKCYLEDEHKLRFFREYRNSDCDQLCLVTGVEQACGCLLFHLPGLRVDRACDVNALPCILKVKMHLYNWLPPGGCDCPRDCESRRYSVEMSTGNFRALPYLLQDLEIDFSLNKSTSIMHFYFPKSVYVKQKQETVMSLISLASNLGGVFGLCIGCSAISVTELCFYIYVAIRNYIKTKIRRH